MENMDMGLTVTKWVLIVWLKIHQMPQNLSAQAQKFWLSMKKSFIGRPWLWQSWQDSSTIYALNIVNAG